MFRKVHFFFLFFYALFLGGVGVRAQQLISAKVLSVEGQVEIRRQSGDQPQIRTIAFKPDDELKPGDTILTGRSGRLVLGLSDGSQAVIAPQSTIVIENLSRSPRAVFNILRGKARVHIEKLGGQPNPYRVNTPTAVIAVRGTIFDTLVDGNETQVFVHEGEVAVINLTLPEQPIFLFAGQMTRVLPQRLPSTPGTFKAGRNDKVFQETKRIAAAGGATRSETERGAPTRRSTRRIETPEVGNHSSDRSQSRSASRSSGRRP